MIRVITEAQYQAIVNSGLDYCECCGGLYKIEGLVEDATMPDLDTPLPGGGYMLQGGHSVCWPCAHHCEDGPCQPDRLVQVQEAADELERHPQEENERLCDLPGAHEQED